MIFTLLSPELIRRGKFKVGYFFSITAIVMMMSATAFRVYQGKELRFSDWVTLLILTFLICASAYFARRSNKV